MPYRDPEPPCWVVLRSSDIYTLPPMLDGRWVDTVTPRTEVNILTPDGERVVLKPTSDMEVDSMGQVAEVYRPQRVIHATRYTPTPPH